jgi:hypothetical protein
MALKILPAFNRWKSHGTKLAGAHHEEFQQIWSALLRQPTPKESRAMPTINVIIGPLSSQHAHA